MEELENLEETLNDSIQESLGARTGKPKRGSHKASLEEEEEVIRFVLLINLNHDCYILFCVSSFNSGRSKDDVI